MISCFGLRSFSPPQQLRRPAVPFGCSSAAIKLPLNKLVAPDSTSCLLSTLSWANVTKPAVVLGSPARQIVESHEFISYSPLHPIPICHFVFFRTEHHLENIWKHVLDLPKNPSLCNQHTSKLIRWAIPWMCPGWCYFFAKAEGNFVRWNYLRQTTLQMS